MSVARSGLVLAALLLLGPAPIALAGYRLVPVEGSWLPRTEGVATLLPDGRVLVSGGRPSSAHGPTPSTELFDPATRRMTAGPRLAMPRAHHAALALPDGRVLIAGGTALSYVVPTASTEIVDPAGESKVIGDLLVPRAANIFLALGPDGSVFAMGGVQEGRFGQVTDVIERLAPGSTTWEPAGVLALPCTGEWARLDADRVLRLPGGVDRAGASALAVACRAWGEEWRLTPRPTGRLVAGLSAPGGTGFASVAWAGRRLFGVTSRHVLMDIDPSGSRMPVVVGKPSDPPWHSPTRVVSWTEDEVVLLERDVRVVHPASGRPDHVLSWTGRSDFNALALSPEAVLIMGGTEGLAPLGKGAALPPLLLVRDPPVKR